MPIFGSSTIKLTRDEFYKTAQEQASFAPYKAKVGAVVAMYLVGALFEDAGKRVDGAGFWTATANVNPGINVTPQTIIKFRSQTELTALKTKLSTMFLNDKGLIDVREVQIGRLRLKATNGELHTDLNTNLEPEINYYTAPPVPVPALGAPPIPPKPPRLVNLAKGTAWATRGVHGDASAFSNAIKNHMKTDGTFPLGSNEQITMSIWNTLVNNVGAYRLPTLGSMYPSSFGGMYLLKNVLTTIHGTHLPGLGDVAWENWALFFFGALMTSQPFVDGNKRISRVTYAIIMTSAGIPFRAPTDAYGARLAAM